VPQISQMMTGGGNFGSLSGVANQFQQANTVYMPQSIGPTDFNASYMQRQGNTLSGVQAMLQQSIGSIQTHIAGITDVQGQLSTATTAADIAAIQGRLQAEQANLAAQGAQAQSLQTMLNAQQQQYQLQQDQNQRRSADDLLQSVTGGAGTVAGSITTIPTFTGG
jgi:Skp family chaperone for outer membrane proteins